MSKTTMAGVLTGVATVAGVIAAYIKTGTMDAQTLWLGLTGIATALGLYKAADGK